MPKNWVIRRNTDQGPEKKCVKCGDWWPITEDFFRRDRQTYDGFDNACKACRQAYRKKLRNEPRTMV